ncbi:MAG: acyl-CoA dehydrogenase family protein [Actinomycetota bacterium]|nr:acyl-CoA dehydrogenase family protein [Actinomycetota bacterium]
MTAEPSESFARSLFLGELRDDLVFPYWQVDPAEEAHIDKLSAEIEAWSHGYDPREAERQRWVGDDAIRSLGEIGALGLFVDPALGGQGLSQTGYCKVFEMIGRVDATLAVVCGVHQSIGYKGIHLFGTEEQKARFLPDLATGRKLAAFALTEPGAGSDAYHLETRARRQTDGSYVLDGDKRYIGNGSRADVLMTFARTDEGAHVALIVEKDMAGFEVGERYDTMGLRGNDLRKLHFRGVRVPAENVLGAEGDGFKVAVSVLNNGRMSLGTGAAGSVKTLLSHAIAHTSQRRQFGRPLADFELVRQKIAWMTSYLYGMEAMTYATTGLVDRGVEDYALESAIVKIAATEFQWYAANRAFQLAGGAAYMTDEPYEKILRDIRIFPVFEGSNDVLRAFVALQGLQGLTARLEDLQHLDVRKPVEALSAVWDYARDRIDLATRPDPIGRTHPELAHLASPLAEQVSRLRSTSERLLRQHGEGVTDMQAVQKRLAHAAIDIFAQTATLARVSDDLATDEPDEATGPRGDEHYIAETFCRRASARVEQVLDRVEVNDDDRTARIAALAYARHGHPLDTPDDAG